MNAWYKPTKVPRFLKVGYIKFILSKRRFSFVFTDDTKYLKPSI